MAGDWLDKGTVPPVIVVEKFAIQADELAARVPKLLVGKRARSQSFREEPDDTKSGRSLACGCHH